MKKEEEEEAISHIAIANISNQFNYVFPQLISAAFQNQ